jgi:hypothetical protein
LPADPTRAAVDVVGASQADQDVVPEVAFEPVVVVSAGEDVAGVGAEHLFDGRQDDVALGVPDPAGLAAVIGGAVD